MKKFLQILAVCVFITTSAQAVPQESTRYTWAHAARDGFLFVGGSWLAWAQQTRMTGQQIDFNAPVFTKFFAWLFFAVGISGGFFGAYQISKELQKKLDSLADATSSTEGQ